MASFRFANMNADDAVHLIKRNPAREFQFYKLRDSVLGGEVEFGMQNTDPGLPTSPIVADADLSVSGMYATFRFQDTPMYMSMPSHAVVSIGWVHEPGKPAILREEGKAV